MYTVREAGSDDVPQLAWLRQRWIAEQETGHQAEQDRGPGVEPADAGQPSASVFEADFRRWMERNPRTFFVAGHGRELVGMVNLLVFERMPKPGQGTSCWVYLGNAYVLPDHRSTGIGTALMKAALEFAQDIGAVRMVLAPSPKSAEFYARLGFGPARELAVHRFTERHGESGPGTRNRRDSLDADRPLGKG
ncbi:GNAT family N-acetyltransferase [Arthrobacter gengyunqii]|uniref:GNAT family N-acetyltransferase n=1 Tax=Arthrobacter gengyunqii TaxID=2886940 RepID=A0A9X1M3L3_9MICC|nr:GNAT family N-acetyltransferase [Arthrobacter gengyunqii]MCC3270759.1 GNAT family N-acetyltransferase [Arthrobacter gengyunqii]UOY96629.1 GNAT family N-acetyltransferase [Arthrobacter gengyunqii]